MSTFIHEAGWGFWPVALFGAIALGVSIYYALRPAARLFALVVGSSVATVIAGCLGAAVGLQNSVRFIKDVAASERWVFLIGLKESLNCVVAAFVLVCLACLITTVGAYRHVRRAERAREIAGAATSAVAVTWSIH